jgi:hypothetical protein
MSTICSPKACTSSSSTYLVVLGESKTIYYKETEKTRYGILLLVYNLNSTFKKGAHENTLSNFSGVYAFEDAILEVVSVRADCLATNTEYCDRCTHAATQATNVARIKTEGTKGLLQGQVAG